jgi:uncharacterized protein (DUF58 family)
MGRAPLRLLPLTLRGIFFLLLSAAILAAGILRSDMAGLFWGSSFLLACLYAVAGNHAMRALLSRKKKLPGFLEVHLPAAVPSPGEETDAGFTVTLGRFFVPGFSARFSLPLIWHDRRIDGVRHSLIPGKNKGTVRFRAEKRGKYSAAAALLEVRDILGFTMSALPIPLNEMVKVFPRVSSMAKPLPVREEGGDAVRYAAHKRRSEELLEVRKYFPGDDVRKLNWKVFAHAHELFLRIGEETPPPESRFLFILDSTSNPLVPSSFAADYLDGLVEACASAMAVLLGRGSEILFWWPGVRQSRGFTQESATDLMGLLADVWWAKPGWEMELPSRAGMHAAVFSTPGSPSLKRIMTELAARGWKADLFLKDLERPVGARRRPRVRDYLLVPPMEEKGGGGGMPWKKSLRPFRDALAEDEARFGAARVEGTAAATRGGHAGEA